MLLVLFCIKRGVDEQRVDRQLVVRGRGARAGLAVVVGERQPAHSKNNNIQMAVRSVFEDYKVASGLSRALNDARGLSSTH